MARDLVAADWPTAAVAKTFGVGVDALPRVADLEEPKHGRTGSSQGRRMTTADASLIVSAAASLCGAIKSHTALGW